jgi:hypothetical protein
MLQIAFGGQVAEELFFGDVSTGPSGDLAFATSTAAQMIGAAGMGDSLVSLSAAGGGPFGGGLVSQVLGDPAAREQVEALLHQQKAVVRGLLSQHRHLVEALRDALLDRHELIGHEITDVLEAAAAAGPAPLGSVAGAAAGRGRHRPPPGSSTSAPSPPGPADRGTTPVRARPFPGERSGPCVVG